MKPALKNRELSYIKVIMKNLTGIISVLVILTVASCSKEDSKSGSNTGTSTSGILSSGTWRVTYYHESNSDHTINFKGYTFTFNANGQMTAKDSLATTTNGTWSSDDSHNEFHMVIGSSSPLSDISNGWLIISITGSECDMKDDNSSHIEELHFQKI